jgi:hypothetical protein
LFESHEKLTPEIMTHLQIMKSRREKKSTSHSTIKINNGIHNQTNKVDEKKQKSDLKLQNWMEGAQPMKWEIPNPGPKSENGTIALARMTQ